MAAIDYLTLRSTLIYSAPGVQAPTGSIFTVGSSGVQVPLSSMVIHTSGNIGIGANVPTAALHIKNTTSAMRITGNLTNTSTRPALSTTPGVFEIRGSGVTDGANDGFLRLSAGGGTSTSLQAYIDLSGSSTVSDMNSTIVLGAGGAERIRITSSGNIGIGSTNPQYPLDLLGTAQMNGAVPSVGQPDTTPLPQSANASFGVGWNIVSTLPSTTWWYGSAISATGQYQTVAVNSSSNGNSIYRSADYGQTWTVPTGFLANAAYINVAISGTGQYQIACTTSGSSALYVSSNYGQTWSATSYTIGASSSGRSSCLSYNGQYQFNCQSQGLIAVSSNYGVTFTNASVSNTGWNSICCSSNGQYVTSCVAGGGTIYYSSNYGVTWTASSGLPVRMWQQVCCSASGQYQFVTSSTNSVSGVWYSTNYGVTWTGSDAPATSNSTWQPISCSSTGQYVIAGQYGGYMYYSINYGVNWTQSGSPSANWATCAISQNGVYSLSTVSYGSVYSSRPVSISMVTNGRIGIGTTLPGYDLHVVGAIYASGNISAFSDQRYKQNIVRLDRSLDAIRSLGGYYYTREDYEPGIRQIGLLAQEVKAVLPEAVCYDSANDKYSVNYNCLMAPVVEAIKELYDRSETQAKTIRDQQSTIQAQQAEIRDQQSAIQAQQSTIQKIMDHLGPL